MIITQTYNFDTPSNYSYDPSLIEIVGSKAALKLYDLSSQDFNEPFDSDTGFTYESDKAEFTGGQVQQKLNTILGQSFTQPFTSDTGFTYDPVKVEFTGGQCQQINKRPANAIFYVDFSDNSPDADWTDVGTGVGTLSDGATVSGGRLDLTGYVANRRLSINAFNTSHNSQQGCMRCLFTPNYSGNPSQLQYIMQWRDGGLENNIQVFQNTSGFLQVWIRDGVGGTILSSASFGVFNFVASQTYEIEFNWDCDAGEHRLFVDGVQQGATASGTGTRDARIDQFDFGVYYNNAGQPNFYITKFIYYDAVQHTTDYTPDWSNIYAYDYLADTVELPTMTYSGNSIDSFTGVTSSESGSPRYILDDQYWTGFAWASSDGSYAQANTISDVNSNIASLTPSGNTLNIDVVFDNSSSQSAVDNLEVTYVGANYLTTDVICPEMEYTGAGTLQVLEAFVTSEGGTPRYTIQVGRSGDYLYWNGSTWAVSDGTYTQANDATTFNTNASSLDIEGEIYGQFKIHFQEGPSQSSVADLTATVTGQQYSAANPKITPTNGLRTDDLQSIVETVTTPGSDTVKYTMSVDGVEKYWTGSAWATSDGTYSQTNTAAEILTNAASLVSVGATVKPIIFLHSAAGTTTPEVEILVLTGDFSGPEPTSPTVIPVYGFVYDAAGEPVSGVSVKAFLNKQAAYSTELDVSTARLTTTTDSNGYWELDLIETTSMPEGSQYYIMLEDTNYNKAYKVSVPSGAASYNIQDLI